MAMELTSENFSQAVEEGKTMLVDFWAPWCGPCRRMAPLLDEIADERKDILVCKVNVDEEPALSAQYGIVSIPSLYVFKNGKVTNQYIGYITKDAVLALLK